MVDFVFASRLIEFHNRLLVMFDPFSRLPSDHFSYVHVFVKIAKNQLVYDCGATMELISDSSEVLRRSMMEYATDEAYNLVVFIWD